MMRKIFIIPMIAAMILAGGCGEESASKRAGKVVGGSLREFGEGAGGAIVDKQNINLTASDAFNSCLEFTVARTSGNFEEGNMVEVYIIAKTPGRYCMRMKAKNADAKEVGRASVVQEFEADAAGYVIFELPREMSFTEAKTYEIDMTPAPAPSPAPAEVPASTAPDAAKQ